MFFLSSLYEDCCDFDNWRKDKQDTDNPSDTFISLNRDTVLKQWVSNHEKKPYTEEQFCNSSDFVL